MNKCFEDAFKVLLFLEGGYSNDKYDSGGETKFGISKKSYGDLDIKELTLDKVKHIYYEEFWKKANCMDLMSVNCKLAKIHFLTAVNTGIKTAIKILQRAINKQGFNIRVDGIFGPVTSGKVLKSNTGLLIRDYVLFLIDYYIKISYHKNNKKYIRGWIKRALTLWSL